MDILLLGGVEEERKAEGLGAVKGNEYVEWAYGYRQRTNRTRNGESEPDEK